MTNTPTPSTTPEGVTTDPTAAQPTQPLTTYLLYTYNGAAPLMPPCVAALRRCDPTAPIAIIDDANNPLPSDMVRALAPDYYTQSKTPRNGNLRGLPWHVEQLRQAIAATNSTHTPYVDKLDPDHLVLANPYHPYRVADPAHTPGAPILLGSHFNAAPAAGCHYSLATHALPQVLQYLLRRQAWDKRPDAPEDSTITTAALTLGTAHLVDMTPNSPLRTAIKYPIGTKPTALPAYFWRLHAVNFGDLPGTPDAHQLGALMSAVLDTIANTAPPTPPTNTLSTANNTAEATLLNIAADQLTATPPPPDAVPTVGTTNTLQDLLPITLTTP
jgi:hypothetical protein